MDPQCQKCFKFLIIEAKPLVMSNSIEIGNFLYKDIVCRHSAPAVILTDNGGSPFINTLIKTVCDNFNIKHVNNSPMHPPGNGLVERFNRTLGQGLCLLDRSDKADWHLHLPAFLLVYRMIRQKSTQHSPFEMLYGRKPRTPFDNYMLTNEQYQKLPEKSYEEDVRHHQEELAESPPRSARTHYQGPRTPGTANHEDLRRQHQKTQTTVSRW